MEAGPQIRMAIWASFLVGFVTTICVFTIRRFSEWGRQNADYFACFAVGVLIAVSFFHLILKSIQLSENVPAYMLTGYLLVHVFNRFMTPQVRDKPTTERYKIGLVAMLGIGFHSLIDRVM